MPQKIVPCLWFNANAEEAVAFYTSLFSGSSLGLSARYGKSAARASGQPESSLMTRQFFLDGQEFLALNGGPAFKFSQALSLYVFSADEDELERLWRALSSGGRVYFELAKYPFAAKYGWCEDRFGLSWQFILSPRRQKISPALLFVNEQRERVEEAMAFYRGVFSDSSLESVAHDPTGKLVFHGRFALAGQDFVAFASPMQHQFSFTPAFSFIVKCDDQAEIDQVWSALSAVPEAEQCGWLRDRFGVSWQIVPSSLAAMVADPDPVKAERVMAKLLTMRKPDHDCLRAVYVTECTCMRGKCSIGP